jgi:hypothetical protein
VVRGDASLGSDIDIVDDVEPSIGLDFVALADNRSGFTACDQTIALEAN